MTYRVAISAGHYPEKQGAVWDGISEFDEAQIWQREICESLRQWAIAKAVDVVVHETQWGGLRQKVAEINSQSCDLAIEIHFNAGGTARTSGAEILIYPNSAGGMSIARRMMKPLAEAMETKSRGIKEGWYRMDRPHVIDFEGDVMGDEVIDYFLRETNCPALILEPEFMQQIENIRRLREAGIEAIVNAITSHARSHIEETTDA